MANLGAHTRTRVRASLSSRWTPRARAASPTGDEEANPVQDVARQQPASPGMCPIVIGDTSLGEVLPVESLNPHKGVKNLDWVTSPTSQDQVGGRLRHFIDNWKIVTQDPMILAAIQGHRLDLMSEPNRVRKVPPLKFSPAQTELVETEVASLLKKQAIVQTDPEEVVFWSQLFLREKKGGGQRPVFNLKRLNQHVKYEHFKMENLAMLPSLIQKGDWMIKTDIKDAYFSIPIAEPDRKFLGFWWQNQAYTFQVCPFGLGSAPRLFTKIMKLVVAFLRRLGIRLILYLDDCLIMNQDRDQLIRDRDTALWLLQNLGFLISWKKSILEPTQNLEFLGFQIESVDMRLTLPQDKIDDIQKRCQKLVESETTSVRKLAKVIGKLTASAQAVLSAPLHYRKLQMTKTKALMRGYQSYESVVILTDDCKRELSWWINQLQECNGKAIMSPQPDLVITTDASKIGWGGEVNGMKTQGQWSLEESKLHINILEMRAAEFVVKAFTKDLEQIHCHIRLDNSSCVAQINKMGGTRSIPLFEALNRLWTYCLSKRITLTAEHIPGCTNLIADEQSRVFKDSSNWQLNPGVFQEVQRTWGPFQVDLFADRLNTQLQQYVSWRPDPNALQVDAFLMSWKDRKAYAFPPFCMIGRCLGKVRVEQATLVLIAPVWQTQTCVVSTSIAIVRSATKYCYH
jgi:hypothetical protein